jgi:hypothetical protein
LARKSKDLGKNLHERGIYIVLTVQENDIHL